MTEDEPQDVNQLVKQLLSKFLSSQPSSKAFQKTEKKILNRISTADSMCFFNEKEITATIDSLRNKFLFHGYRNQANNLKTAYHKFLKEDLNKSERNVRLNIVKFLLEISESPTNNVKEDFFKLDTSDAEIIDWPKYLTEGIPRWSPTFEDSSDCWSEDLNDTFSDTEEKPSAFGDVFRSRVAKKMEGYATVDKDSETNLSRSVQSGWFSSNQAIFEPISDDSEANLALRWANFVQSLSHGLLSANDCNILSEYKVLREIIWQFYEPHESFCFTFNRDELVPKENVTIASVRPVPFESFVREFIPYVNWLENLNSFHRIISTFPLNIPDTYKSYNFAVRTILAPVYEELQLIEQEIKLQDTTYTLIKLATVLKPIFKPLKVLNNIHKAAALSFNDNPSVTCATTLLCHLHEQLSYAKSKLEQDIYITLYLESLYKYFSIMDSWLVRDVLEDSKNEFVISDCQNEKFTSQINYSVKELNEDVMANCMITIICGQVVQIGRNVHLLRLLHKLHLLTENTDLHKETFYQTFLKEVLQNISVFFNVAPPIGSQEIQLAGEASTDVAATICPDHCKYLTEMDKIENLVDTNDAFLMKAFEDYFVTKVEAQKIPGPTLFEKISKLTKGLFPIQKIIEHSFKKVLQDRFGASGLVVKQVLNEYNLEKQFAFLKNIFLFDDDLIFPFYRRIFRKLDINGVWGNPIWLTSYLQDVIMDSYPQFYMETSVEVKEHWKHCTDQLKACEMININYKIQWPINIIIRDEQIAMYKDIFQFILKIKWALYTLNHLYFHEISQKGKSIKSQPKPLRFVIVKLFNIRFGLLNIFSSIQHYILGQTFSKFTQQLTNELEKASDLDSLIEAHSNFIHSYHKACMGFQEYNSKTYGFCLLSHLVKKLRQMWSNMKEIDDEELLLCESSYMTCYKKLDPIINPTDYQLYMLDN